MGHVGIIYSTELTMQYLSDQSLTPTNNCLFVGSPCFYDAHFTTSGLHPGVTCQTLNQFDSGFVLPATEPILHKKKKRSESSAWLGGNIFLLPHTSQLAELPFAVLFTQLSFCTAVQLYLLNLQGSSSTTCLIPHKPGRVFSLPCSLSGPK